MPTKIHLVKAIVFPVVICGCENWTIKKAECQRIDAFELMVMEKTVESPLDSKEGLEAGGEGDDRRLDGWMASPTQLT